jgi:hypothetical protein
MFVCCLTILIGSFLLNENMLKKELEGARSAGSGVQKGSVLFMLVL